MQLDPILPYRALNYAREVFTTAEMAGREQPKASTLAADGSPLKWEYSVKPPMPRVYDAFFFLYIYISFLYVSYG